MSRLPPASPSDPRSVDDQLASARTVRTDPGAVDRTIPIAAPSAPTGGGRRYEIRKELGRGGEGAVFLAFDRHADEVVALKVLDNVASGSEHLARLRRELTMARRITHPGIVRLHDLVEIDGRWALSMEYIDGSSLESRIEAKEHFSADAIAVLARDLAAALAAAHDAGVTHRDLKPANVLLRADGRPVISDFGISRVHASRASSAHDGARSGAVRVTQEGALVGTPLYMAPEQLEGRSAGPPVDVYALGLILFELATGVVPHAEGSLQAIIRRRTSEDAPPVESQRPDLPLALAALIDRCLSRSPADRFADGKAVVAALAPRPAGPTSRGASRGPPRRRLVVAALGGGIVVSALAFAGYWVTRATHATPVASTTSSASGAVPEAPPFALRASGHRRVTYDAGCEEFPWFFPDSKHIVFDGTSGPRSNLYVADVDTGQTKQLTESPGWDYAAQVSPDGKQVVFLRGDDERIGSYVIAADGSAPARFLYAGSIRPSFTADGSQVWSGQPMSPSRIDVATGSVLEVLPLSGTRQAWNVLGLENGDLAVSTPPFMESNQGGISVASGPVGARVWQTLLLDSVEEVLTLSPDGTHFITAREGPNASELLAVPRDGGAVVRLADSAIAPGKGLAFSPDRKRVVWSTCRGHSSVVSAVQDVNAPPQAWEDLDASRLPNGKLAVVSARDGSPKLWVIDPSGHAQPRPYSAAFPASGIGASPDGTFVVATTTSGLRVLTEDLPARVLTEEAGDSEPTVSLDGRSVLFTRRVAGGSKIFRASLDGKEVAETRAVGSMACAIEGDGDFIFIEERDGKQQPMIWRASRAVAEPLAATLPPGRYGRPDVSPDGKLVAVPRRGTEIVVLDRASGRVERSYTLGGDQLSRPMFLSDGTLYLNRVRWFGDVWVADLAP